jgi:hypothetical protein
MSHPRSQLYFPAEPPQREEAIGHYRRVRDEIRAFVETLPGSVIDGKETQGS